MWRDRRELTDGGEYCDSDRSGGGRYVRLGSEKVTVVSGEVDQTDCEGEGGGGRLWKAMSPGRPAT